jgi:hypothetical protein
LALAGKLEGSFPVERALVTEHLARARTRCARGAGNDTLLVGGAGGGDDGHDRLGGVHGRAPTRLHGSTADDRIATCATQCCCTAGSQTAAVRYRASRRSHPSTVSIVRPSL